MQLRQNFTFAPMWELYITPFLSFRGWIGIRNILEKRASDVMKKLSMRQGESWLTLAEFLCDSRRHYKQEAVFFDVLTLDFVSAWVEKDMFRFRFREKGKKMVQFKRTLVMLLAMVFLLAGCKVWLPWQSRTGMARANPESIYQQGLEEYNAGRYKRSIELFQRVKEEYPLSTLAIMAEMGVADSFFSSKQYPEAALAYEEFINLHPTNENLPYAMYQSGMCYLNQMTSMDRDNSEVFKAMQEFEKLAARFPDSQFTGLALKKIKECKKLIGEKELYIGEFYFKTKKYKAALRRLEGVARLYADIGLDDQKVHRLIAEAKKRLNPVESRKKWWLF